MGWLRAQVYGLHNLIAKLWSWQRPATTRNPIHRPGSHPSWMQAAPEIKLPTGPPTATNAPAGLPPPTR